MSYTDILLDLHRHPTQWNEALLGQPREVVRYLAALLVQDKKQELRRLLHDRTDLFTVRHEGRNFLHLLVEHDEVEAFEQAWFMKSELPDLEWPGMKDVIQHDADFCADFMLEEGLIEAHALLDGMPALRLCATSTPPACRVAFILLKHDADVNVLYEGSDMIEALYQSHRRLTATPSEIMPLWKVLVRNMSLERVEKVFEPPISSFLLSQDEGRYQELLSCYQHRMLDATVEKPSERRPGARL